jgi:hypothetical protein
MKLPCILIVSQKCYRRAHLSEGRVDCGYNSVICVCVGGGDTNVI